MIQNSELFEIRQSKTKLSRDIMKNSDHQLGTKFRLKYDIYSYLTETLHLYLPPKEYVTKDFIKQILKNEKELMKMDEIKTIKVPRYPKLSVKTLFQEAIEDEQLKKYLPDLDLKKKLIDREYFFNILNTIYPEYIKSLISHAQNSRIDPVMNETKKDYILISDDWYNKLLSHPFISSNIFFLIYFGKPGKTVQLLKESTKLLKGRKPKAKKELGFTLKRFKGMNETYNIGDESKNSSKHFQVDRIYEEKDENIMISGLQNKKRFNI